MKYKINITDKDGNDVFEGDKFMAHMVRPYIFPGKIVKVVKDISPKNVECDRDFDVEDAEGNRIWNAYMVIKNGDRVVEPLHLPIT